MKRLFGSVIALSLAMGMPALAHVGHGDEFQAEGGVNRVEVKAETDSLLGIQVSPIEPAADGSAAITVPVTALVEDNGRQLVFVEYEGFYEPVPVTLGATVGDQIEIVDGVSVGEQLVTQGSLSLYAESRKTQTAEPEAIETPELLEPAAETTEVEAVEVEAVEVADVPADASDGFPLGLMAAIGTGAILLVGAVVVVGSGKQGDA